MQRGGEDVHVETLQKIYESLGHKVLRFPRDASFIGENSLSILRGLASEELPKELRIGLDSEENAIVHIHNIHPVPGVALLKYLMQSKHRVWMTVHNHRMYCANGLARYDGKECYECRESISASRPLIKNCNQDRKRSAYYGMAVAKIRNENLWAKAIDDFIVPSEYIADEVSAVGIPRAKIHIIPHSVTVPSAILEVDDSSEMSKDPARKAADFVYFGRLSEEKGIKEIVEIAEHFPNYRFRVIGDGPLANFLQSKSLENLEFLRGLGRDSALKAARNCRFALSLSTCNESFSMWPVEAALLGIPSLVSDLPYSEWMRSENLPVHFVNMSDKSSMLESVEKILTEDSPMAVDSVAIAARFSQDRYGKELSQLMGIL